MKSDLIIKATIEVIVQYHEEDAKWFREQEGREQAAALTRLAGDLKDHTEQAIDAPRHEIKIDIMEVPEWG